MKSVDPVHTLVQQQAFLDAFESLPFDDAAAEAYGRIRAELARRGTPIGPNDLMIAAIALVEDAACFWRRSQPHSGHAQHRRILPRA